MSGRSLDGAAILSLRIFVTVAEAQSFSAAARQLRISPSAITNHIGGLERMIGVALFHRTTRKVGITAAGERFYQQSTAILSQVDDVLQTLSPSAKPSGQLRVTAPPSFAVQVLGPNISTFLERYKDVNIDLIVSAAAPNMIADRIDVAFLLREEPEGKLAHFLLSPNPRAFCASPEYLERHGVPQTPDDLHDHSCVVNIIAGGAEPWSFREGKTVRQVHVQGQLLSDNGEVLRRASLSGGGIGSFYKFHVGEDLKRGDLIEVLADYQPGLNRIYAMTPHREMIRPLTQLFIDFVREQLAASELEVGAA